MPIHLLSAPQPMLRDVVDLCRPYLQGRPAPMLLYLPPRIKETYVTLTQQAFDGLAEVQVIDLFTVCRDDFLPALQKAALLFVPGGNTFLFNQLIHRKGLYGPIRRAVLNGLPYVGFSAGALVCGDNILTSHDINVSGCSTFAGFGFTAVNFLAHYPSEDGPARAADDALIAAYHEFHDNPVLALEDDACVFVEAGQVRHVRGRVWCFMPGKDRQPFA